MSSNDERIRRIQRALEEARLDAMVCTLPSHVLLLSGYWPVVGTAIAIATATGQVVVIAPEDEQELAQQGWMNELRVFKPASLDHLSNTSEAIVAPLHGVVGSLGLHHGRIGIESDASYQPASYASVNFYGSGLRGALNRALPRAALAPADDLLLRLESTKTPAEIERIRAACRVAERAFDRGAGRLEPGMTEMEAATLFRPLLSTWYVGAPQAGRMDGFTFCMSGPNAAEAHGAYQRSRRRRLTPGDLVLIHCNSYVDGYWTDITRTYCLGEPDQRQHDMYETVFAARQAALAAVRPGTRASSVDHAARQIMEANGFGGTFKHPTGHGAGFAAINHRAHPRLHPKSQDVLEVGSVFNVEPGIYIDGYSGMRHCDMVAVGQQGAEVLTAFQNSIEECVQLALPALAGP